MGSLHCRHLRAASCALLGLLAACTGDATAPAFADPPTQLPPAPASMVAAVSVSPSYRATSSGEPVAFQAKLLDAQGRALAGPAVEWISVDPALVTVDQSGNVDPRKEGVARVVARSGQAADTAIVAVLGAKDLLVSALPEGAAKAHRAPGETVTVPITLDLSRVSTSGDLGSIQFDLQYDPRLLDYVSSRVGATGTGVANLVEPGRVRFALAATEVQGRGVVPLLTLQLRVKSGAPAGASSSLTISYTDEPVSTGFRSYERPVTVAGTVVVSQQ